MTRTGRPRKQAPKRANGEGSVVLDPRTGRWRMRLTIGVKANGRPNMIDRLYRTEGEAHEALAEFRRQFFERDASGIVPTVGGVAQAWVKSESGAWEVSRQRIVTDEVDRHIARDPLIGHLPADRLTMLKVKDWMQGLADAGLSWPTIRTYRQHLATAYGWAARVPGTRVKANPVILVGSKWRPLGVRLAKEKTWLTLDEARSFVAYCRQPAEPWGPFFLACAMLGMRPGEAFALNPMAIDFDASTVHIGAGLKRDGDRAHHVGLTKNSRTGEPKSRTVDASVVVLEALRRQIDTVELARSVYADEWSDRWPNLIFVTTKHDRGSRPGEIVAQSNVRTNLTRVCQEAGIRRITPYELRHSCASILLHTRKLPPAVVADMLGTSELMLRRHYAHLMDPVIRGGAAVWDEILDG
jgi:integrase